MIALKNPPTNIDIAPASTLRLDANQPMERPAQSHAPKPEIGQMELKRSHKAILFSVKVYLLLMVGLFGFHFWTVLK